MPRTRKRQRVSATEDDPIIIKEEPGVTEEDPRKAKWIRHEDILSNFIPNLDTNTVMQYKAVYEIIMDLQRQLNDLTVYKKGRISQVDEEHAKALAKLEERQMLVLRKIDEEHKNFEHMHAQRMQDVHRENLLTMQKLKEYQEYFMDTGEYVLRTVQNMRDTLSSVTQNSTE